MRRRVRPVTRKSVKDKRRRRHGDDTNRGAVSDTPRELGPDQNPLVETPVTDCRRPRKQQRERSMREGRDRTWKRQHILGQPREHRPPQHEEHPQGDQQVQRVAEVPELFERLVVSDQCRGRAQNHDDGRFDDESERKRHAVGREIERRLVESRDHRGKKRTLDRHHQPCRRERHPQPEDSPVGYRRVCCHGWFGIWKDVARLSATANPSTVGRRQRPESSTSFSSHSRSTSSRLH